ncbi:hypothetical protein M8J75_010519 [Diaphorina citri]|nr:hypothetical protein M8J75_010519 [Diaphorina citri]
MASKLRNNTGYFKIVKFNASGVVEADSLKLESVGMESEANPTAIEGKVNLPRHEEENASRSPAPDDATSKLVDTPASSQ